MSEARVLEAARAIGENMPGDLPGVMKQAFGEVAQTGAELALEHYRPLLAALRSIAGNTCCDGCQEARRVAEAALRKAGVE